MRVRVRVGLGRRVKVKVQVHVRSKVQDGVKGGSRFMWRFTHPAAIDIVGMSAQVIQQLNR